MLFQKAEELCLLCSAEAAVFVQSETGKMFVSGNSSFHSFIHHYLQQKEQEEKNQASRDKIMQRLLLPYDDNNFGGIFQETDPIVNGYHQDSNHERGISLSSGNYQSLIKMNASNEPPMDKKNEMIIINPAPSDNLPLTITNNIGHEETNIINYFKLNADSASSLNIDPSSDMPAFEMHSEEENGPVNGYHRGLIGDNYFDGIPDFWFL